MNRPEDSSMASDEPVSNRSSGKVAGDCPGFETLEEYAAKAGSGQMSEQDQSIEEHLRSCRKCGELLVAMRSAESFLERFRGPIERSSDGRISETGLPSEPRIKGPDPTQLVAVDGYEVEGFVAIGGQGAIYKAYQRGTRRCVAIKLPLGNTQRNPSTRYRFEREVELAARLDHPGLVRIIEACRSDDGRLGYVMEWVEGETIDRWASRARVEGKTGRRRVVSVIADVADAIAYAHLRAVLHRDIKPSNVIVTKDGRPRVLDFGLAKSMDASKAAFETITGAFLGTLAYAAPEQIDGGSEATDIRTDVYALGLLLFIGLTGVLPYRTDSSTSDLIRQIRQGEPVCPSTIAPEIPKDLDAIVLKALSKDKERRYSTAAEFREDLLAWLAGRAVQARFDSRWYVMRKTIARHRRVVAAGVAMGFVVTAGVAAFAYAIASTEAARSREEYEKGRAAAETVKADAVQQLIDEILPITSGSGESVFLPSTHANLDLLDRKLEAGLFRNQVQLEASVRGMLSSIYDDRGTLGRAELHARHAFRLHQIEMGEEHSETFRAADKLAGILIQRGKLKEAESLARKALAARSRLLSSSHPDVVASEFTLAKLELVSGRTAEAQNRLNTIKLNGGVDPREQPMLASSLLAIELDIAMVEHRTADAIALAELLVTQTLSHRSDDHPEVARALRRLANTERAAGLEERANWTDSLASEMISKRGPDRTVQTWSRLLELKGRLFGESDIELASTLVLKGLAQQSARSYADALISMQRALAILERVEGSDSLVAIDCKWQFRESMIREGHVDALEAALRNRYEVYRQRQTGRLDIMIIVSHREWARWLGEIGRDDQALNELQRVKEELHDIGYDDPIEWVRAELEVAELHAARGDIALAAATARSIVRNTADNPHLWWEHERAQMVLVSELIEKGSFAEAEPAIQKAAALRPLQLAGLFRGDHVERRAFKRWIAAYHSAQRQEPPVFSHLRTIYQVMDEQSSINE